MIETILQGYEQPRDKQWVLDMGAYTELRGDKMSLDAVTTIGYIDVSIMKIETTVKQSLFNLSGEDSTRETNGINKIKWIVRWELLNVNV